MNEEFCIDYPLGTDVPSWASLATAKKWPNGSVLDGNPVVQTRVAAEAARWSDCANILFDFGDHADAHIRISFRHSGSWSTLGTDALDVPDNQPTMNYGWLLPGSTEAELRRVV